MRHGLAVADRQQPARGEQRIGQGREVDRIVGRRAHVAENAIERLDHRHVEDIDPDGARLAVVVVAVPGPVGRHDQITVAHVAAQAVDEGAAALPLEHDAQRRGRVAVRAGALARQHALDGADDVGDRGEAPLEMRVGQDQHAVVGIMAGDGGGCRLYQRREVAPAPDVRRHRARRLLGHDLVVDLPERGQPLLGHGLVERRAIGRRFFACRLHRHDRLPCRRAARTSSRRPAGDVLDPAVGGPALGAQDAELLERRRVRHVI